MVFADKAPDILLVDDMPANLRVLSDVLREEGYRTRSALSAEMALRAAETEPPDLILLDVMMPEMDGYEVCRRLKANPRLAGVPVIFLSALDEVADKIRAFSAGGVDYVTKPFQIDEVKARVNTHLRLRELHLQVEQYSQRLESIVREQVKEIADSQLATIFALARLAESRDDDTGLHLERVQALCETLATGMAERCAYDEIDTGFVRDLVHASPLHDIGKVAISDAILLKPGKLTAEEFEIIKTHTTLGAQTLEAVHREYPRNALIATGIDVVLSHHERWDGHGYPNGLAAADIPLSARIMSVVDVYDALRSKRVYKAPMSHEQSCEIIISEAGRQFDPGIVEVFSSLHQEFDRIEAEHSA